MFNKNICFRNPEFWSSDTLIILSDLLIVLNQNQLNSIPKMSRLNSADIIHTQYADEIEWLSHNIPFYKVSIKTNKNWNIFLINFIFRVVNSF